MAQRRFGPWHEVPRQREARLQRSLECHRGGGKVEGDTSVQVATGGLLNFLRGVGGKPALAAVQRDKRKNQDEKENKGQRIPGQETTCTQ